MDKINPWRYCIDCKIQLSNYARHDLTIQRCKDCASKYSYTKRLPTIICAECKREEKATNFNQRYCSVCQKDKLVINKRRYVIINNHRVLHPEKYKARMIMTNKHGKIPEDAVCKICGIKAEERHHKDYSKPLEYIYVCIKHHRMIDGGEIKCA